MRYILFILALLLPLWGEETVVGEPVSQEIVTESVETVEASSQTETPSESRTEPIVPLESDLESFDLEAHIAKIKAAKGDERRLLMNELKAELRVMNQENRSNALKALGQSLSQGQGMQHRQGGQAAQQGGSMQQNMQHQQRMGGGQAGRGRP